MKSSHPDLSFASFVRRALDAIRTEVPWAHEALRGALSGWTTLLVMDGEPATVRADDGIVVTGDSSTCDVVCTTTSRTILGLVRGSDTLLDAVLSNRIELVGDVGALLAWHDALHLFLHGAVRARAFEGLLRDFQGRLGD